MWFCLLINAKRLQIDSMPQIEKTPQSTSKTNGAFVLINSRKIIEKQNLLLCCRGVSVEKILHSLRSIEVLYIDLHSSQRKRRVPFKNSSFHQMNLRIQYQYASVAQRLPQRPNAGHLDWLEWRAYPNWIHLYQGHCSSMFLLCCMHTFPVCLNQNDPDYTEFSRIENLENDTSSSPGQSYMLPHHVMPSKFSDSIPSYRHLSKYQVGFYKIVLEEYSFCYHIYSITSAARARAKLPLQYHPFLFWR